jgi:hypothetical protein
MVLTVVEDGDVVDTRADITHVAVHPSTSPATT